MTLSPLRILLVEADDAYAAMIDVELRRAAVAAELRRAHTLAEARHPSAHAGVDVVVLDLGLPDSSGLDTLRAMRDAVADVPIVVLTAANCDVLALTAVRSGAEDYLVKGDTGPRPLARALRHACERAWSRQVGRGSADQLLCAQQMNATGRLAGSVAHDFNNALTAIFGYVDLLLDQLPPADPWRSDIEEIRRSAERASTLTRQLLSLSRDQPRQPQTFDLDDRADLDDAHRLLSRSRGGTFVESDEEGASRLLVCLLKAEGS